VLNSTDSQSLPNIIISDSCYDQLTSAASAALGRSPEVTESAPSELERAKAV
jgi:hypothetical protein